VLYVVGYCVGQSGKVFFSFVVLKIGLSQTLKHIVLLPPEPQRLPIPSVESTSEKPKEKNPGPSQGTNFSI
jgi:hypothetical protein